MLASSTGRASHGIASACRTPCRASPKSMQRAVKVLASSSSSSSSSGNVLVVGSGGREHALAWKFSASPSVSTVFCAPGNAGTGVEHNIHNVKLNPSNHDQVIKFCKEKNIGFVLVGPEQPLVEGLVDALTSAGITAFGPSASAARLEGSKEFMKNLCRKYSIPTATYEVFDKPEDAKAYVRQHGAPIVVKTSGLAAGKGVILCQTVDEATQAINDMIVGQIFGSAGDTIVVEEFLTGEEASFFALIDGETCIPLVGAQDHKAVGEGDTGPNTGGMGSYSPAPVLTQAIIDQVMTDIVRPTACGMVAEGCPFRGVLFAGLMIENGKAKLLEHNVRFGDPECQSIMVRLKSDLLETLQGALRGEASGPLEWDPNPSLTVVVAANGYPGSYAKGTVINGLDTVPADLAKVFHAGTDLDDSGRVISTGGRVLGVTATGTTVAEAQRKAYEAVDLIIPSMYPDGFVRRDIGWRAI